MYAVVKANAKEKRHLTMERAEMMSKRPVEVAQALELDANQCLGS